MAKQSQLDQELIRAALAGQQAPQTQFDPRAISQGAIQGMDLAATVEDRKRAQEDRIRALQEKIQAAKQQKAQQQRVEAYRATPSIETATSAYPELRAKEELQSTFSEKKLPQGPEFTKIGETPDEIILADLKDPSKQYRVRAPGAGKKQAGPSLTAGQEAADKEFGKEYNAYVAQGGNVGFKSNLNKLDAAIKTLEGIGKQSGSDQLITRGSSALPDLAQGIVAPEYKQAQQDARSNVLGILRQTLGPQFTEKEGERIFDQTFDPSLPIAQNTARLKALRDSLAGSAADKEAAIRHFEQFGTLAGFTGKLPATKPAGNPDQNAGLSPEKAARLAELRAKKAAGTLGR